MVPIRRELSWFGQPIITYTGTLGELRNRLPAFARQALGLGDAQNEFLDLIVREPFGDEVRRIPVAAVSRQYDLVQHRDVLDWVSEALATIGYAAHPFEGQLTLSKYAERMHLQIGLPQFDFDPGDGKPLALLVHAVNSVDKTTAFEISLGWWRQVCGNGLKVRVSGSGARRIHLLGRTSASQVAQVLKAQLGEVPAECKRYRQWVNTPVGLKSVEDWADRSVAKAWGPHAAARVCHIARTGWDGEIEDPFEKVAPHERVVRSQWHVPGAFAPAENAFHVSQALSWLASHRGTIQGRFERMSEIHGLMSSLLQERRN